MAPRVPVLIGIAAFDKECSQGVAFSLDLTERKRAEAEIRENERRYRELQMELAHANRVATMGQLSASIAHEINQPIAAVIANANAGLRWLGAQQADLDEVRQALRRIVRDGTRSAVFAPWSRRCRRAENSSWTSTRLSEKSLR
jgi:C4-dicarboxylate-specific signal transduction histidine kinase